MRFFFVYVYLFFTQCYYPGFYKFAISEKMDEHFNYNIVASKNWKLRKEALEAVDETIKSKKMNKETLRNMVCQLRKAIEEDSNVNIIGSYSLFYLGGCNLNFLFVTALAVNCIANIAKKNKKIFKPYARSCTVVIKKI